jgi:3-deoxy-7-phosphoheptulonate synthase
MSQAAIACGTDGLLIEVHPNPDKALKDGFQSITMDSFAQLMPRLSAVAEAVGRRISIPAAV